ncbi:unnamed protein product [Phytophthora fragariaefolia]|uniref:Unnamed protein product n=1 Tax=Phytophthora fragariaefolia TaxID=1490495 RepID=A0A9W6WYK2_9STRA|nr:unnamed protein product [Phytophthora fragariaefolia]
MRRAAAHIALQRFGLAVDDLVAALGFEPRNKECRAKLQVIVDCAVGRKQTLDVELRYAGVRAAVVLSVRDGWLKRSVRGNPGPAAVNGHTLFRGSNDNIYLFGGRAVREQNPALFALHKNDNSSWDIVPTRETNMPLSRAWHTTSAIGDRKSEWYCVYGGISSRGEDPNVKLLVPATPRGFQWLLPRCLQDPAEIPAPRSGHAAVSITEENGDRAVYMFGGRTKQGVSDQLLILRCSSTEAVTGESDAIESTQSEVVWDQVHSCENHNVGRRTAWPSARDGHSMCLLDGIGAQPQRLIVFGGNGQLNDEKMNDTWLFNLEKKDWTLLQCSGDFPPPRSYHTAHTVGEFLFVIGGRTTQSEDSSVYMLDIGILKWFKVPIPADQALTSRAWHSSVLTEAGKLFVLGGGTYHGPLKDAATLDLGYFQEKAPFLGHTTG